MLTNKRKLDTRPVSDFDDVSRADLKIMEESIDTNRDAIEYVTTLINMQLVSAEEHGVRRDIKIEGDRYARLAFLSFLGIDSQRMLFMGIFNKTCSVQRLQSIFGAPPYPWLKDGDVVVLNAAGISRSRVNMSPSAVGGVLTNILNYNTFGMEHYIDQNGRQYRVTPTETTRPDDPFFISHAITALSQFETTCRIPKKVVKRVAGGRPVYSRQKQRFPRMGEVLYLSQSKLLGAVKLLNKSKELSATVIKVAPRSSGSATALIQLRRMS